MNPLAYFEIQADDTKRAMQFYSDVFKWQFTEMKGAPVEYWSIETGNTRGGILKRPAAAPPSHSGTNAYVCSFQVDDFDAMALKITQNAGGVALPKFAVPGKCWQGYFLDTEGNTFGLFEVDESAK